MLSRAINKFNIIPIKMQIFSMEKANTKQKTVLKSIWTLNGQNSLKKEQIIMEDITFSGVLVTLLSLLRQNTLHTKLRK